MSADQIRPDLSGILLAGGASRRFPPNKLLVTYNGRPLFWRPLSALAAVCDEIVVVVRAGEAAPPLPVLDVAVRVTHDVVAGEGPLVALARGLEGVRHDWVLLAAGDMPDLRVELLAALAKRAATSAADVIALADGQRPRPMPALLRVSAARAAVGQLVASGERRLRALLAGPCLDVCDESWWVTHDPQGFWRRDVDRPQ